MKQLLSLLLLTSLFFVSCSTDEVIENQDNNSNMLEKYVIKRNANGSYTLTHVVSQGVGTMYVDDEKTNLVQLFFDGKALNNTQSRDYNVVNNQLNINFETEDNSFRPSIQIIDEDTNSKGTYGLLEDYSVSENADGSVTLEYAVENGVKVEYAYNDAEGIYEIRLAEDSNATQKNFTATYQRDASGSIKVDFVQPEYDDKEEGNDYKKPRIIAQIIE